MPEKNHCVFLGKTPIGHQKALLLIAGPCVIENEKSARKHALTLRKITDRLKIPFVFKSSYDKANRTSASAYRGVGLKAGLAILKKIKEEAGVKILTDIHEPAEAAQAAEVADILQIPAFLCRQTDLLTAAAKTGRIINVKKGQFAAPWDMKYAIDKIARRGNKNILLTERGACFGYNALVSDFRSIPIMKEFGYPVIYDATHSVQSPGGRGASSGGDRRFVPMLAQAAVIAGADGIFMEVHENPDKAPSDGRNMLFLRDLEGLLKKLIYLSQFKKSFGA